MKALVSGELLVGENVKIVFNGKPYGAKLYVGEGDNWQHIRYCREFRISNGPDGYITLDIGVEGVVEGELFAEPAKE